MTDMNTSAEAIEAKQIVEKAVALTTNFRVTTAEQYSSGGEALKEIKGAQKRLEALRVAITAPLNAALKAANDLFRAPAEQLVEAEKAIKTELIRYQDEQERIRREEQRKLEEAARREREKAESAARAAREKAEEEAAELRRKADAEAAAGRAAEAARLAARADQKVERAEIKADTFEQVAATVVAPVIRREAPKVAGLATRKVWKAEVVDLMALVKAVAEGKAPLALLMANDKLIGQQARSLGAEFVTPGIKVWSESSLSAGAA